MPEDKDKSNNLRNGFSRRQFLKGVGIAGTGTALGAGLLTEDEEEAAALPMANASAGQTLKKGAFPVSLNVNGQMVSMNIEPRTTLLNALRNHADPPITGPKLVCDQGACGACTVLVDDKTAYSCMLLAADVVGGKITTIEGLSHNDKLSIVQEAFVEKDALMCGFCTPGFVLSLTALLNKKANPTTDEVKAACAGNTCRCGTYPHIFEAAQEAAKKMKG